MYTLIYAAITISFSLLIEFIILYTTNNYYIMYDITKRSSKALYRATNNLMNSLTYEILTQETNLVAALDEYFAMKPYKIIPYLRRQPVTLDS